jgi:hypothetical protein
MKCSDCCHIETAQIFRRSLSISTKIYEGQHNEHGLAVSAAREHPRRIQNECQFGTYVDERCQQRIKESQRGEHDAGGIDRQSAVKILHNHGSTLAGNAQGFDKP